MIGSVPIPRIAGRMFLIDPEQRVLLLQERLDLDSDQSHWITPGGGLEGSETLAEAAMREVYEETGLRIDIAVDAVPMFTERVEFHFAGNHFDQTNHYFLVQVPGDLLVVPAAQTAFERVVSVGHRWWSLADLDASDVRREPIAIVELIRRAVAVSE